MKSTVKTIVTLAIIGVALYFTNPTMTDFGSYYERKQVAASQKKGVSGVLGDIVKAVAQSGADMAVKIGFSREDKLLFSTYTLGLSSKPSERYLGFAKVVFIQLK